MENKGPLRYVPTKPSEYKRHLNILIERLGREEVIRRLGWTPEQLDNALKSSQAIDDQRYARGILRMIEANPNYTEDEILQYMGVTREWMDGCRPGAAENSGPSSPGQRT